MKLLVLGGTVFLGRAIARHAVAAGHEVTCAARGTSGSPPEGVRLVPVDRDGSEPFAELSDERFDAVIDVARRPSHVRRALTGLADRVGHWTFVSSISVYADTSTSGQLATTAKLLDAAPPKVDDAAGEHYGPCKVTCEQEVLAAGVPAFVCRAGLIVGPEDPSGRFGYWAARLAGATGQEMLAPGNPDDLVQWIDVRDLAAWLLHGAETGLTGVYDGAGVPVSRQDFLAGIAAGVAADPQLTWVNQDFLAEQSVAPWMGPRSLPLWLPLPEYGGFLSHDVTASLAAGLAARPLTDTARDTVTWLHSGASLPEGAAGLPKCGLTPAEEAEVLAAWHSQPA